MGSAMPPPRWLSLPAVDERLVMPETRYEVEDGRVLYVSPADEPHGSRHSKLSALLEAYVREPYDAATDMLTRTSVTDDVAPDASVFLRERDPETGGRHLEELAFEIVSTERIGHTETKARKLVGRGVRRVFAIDVERQRVLEWSRDLESWQMLSPSASIEDPVFAAALPVEALMVAGKTDDAMALGLIAKGNRVIDARVAEGRSRAMAEAILEVLRARGLGVPEDLERQVLACADAGKLRSWLARAATAENPSELLDQDETA